MILRQLTKHVVPGDEAANQIIIGIADAPGAGGANHHYVLMCPPPKALPATTGFWPLSFQNGPIKEFGVNGITQEALLAIVIDRLECFQAGPFSSDYNQEALEHCLAALAALQRRTLDRIARNVEGTNQK